MTWAPCWAAKKLAAHLCLEEVTGHYSTSRGLNSNTFVNVAIATARTAISFYVQCLNTIQHSKLDKGFKLYHREMREEEHRRQEEEHRRRNIEQQRQATFAQQQHLRKLRAKQASDELWARYHQKERAATSINMFIRRVLFIRWLRHRINNRITLK